MYLVDQIEQIQVDQVEQVQVDQFDEFQVDQVDVVVQVDQIQVDQVQGDHIQVDQVVKFKWIWWIKLNRIKLISSGSNSSR